MAMDLPDLLRTDLHLIGLTGRIEEHEDHFVARTPSNPDFYHGNFLLLSGPPDDLDRWLHRFEEAFGPEVKHRCLTWPGDPLGPEVEAQARPLGLQPDSGVGLALDEPPEPGERPEGIAPEDWEVRPLDPERDWERFVELSILCDPAEGDGSPSYSAFKQRLRETIRAWLAMGAATWWGAFAGDELIGQCGFVVCGDLGRYQGVETHPAFRRRGVCSTLIRTVARHAFHDLRCRRVLLEADRIGPAVGLYERVGFVAEGPFHSLVWPSEPLLVRPEREGESTAVRSLNEAAFDTAAEAALVDALRGGDGVISLVATQSGGVIGHALFSPVRVGEGEEERTAVALGPMAVRPDRQGQGVGTALVQAGLEACRAAGYGACFVLGHPTFYPRAGFVPAPPLGLTCQWPVPEEVFMVVELQPGGLAGLRGQVHYDAAFEAV